MEPQTHESPPPPTPQITENPPSQQHPPDPVPVLPAKHINLQTQISSTRAQLSKTLHELQTLISSNSSSSLTTTGDEEDKTLREARLIVRKHMALLKRYNATKDTALLLTGLIADRDGRVLRDVLDEHGVTEDM